MMTNHSSLCAAQNRLEIFDLGLLDDLAMALVTPGQSIEIALAAIRAVANLSLSGSALSAVLKNLLFLFLFTLFSPSASLRFWFCFSRFFSLSSFVLLFRSS